MIKFQSMYRISLSCALVLVLLVAPCGVVYAEEANPTNTAATSDPAQVPSASSSPTTSPETTNITRTNEATTTPSPVPSDQTSNNTPTGASNTGASDTGPSQPNGDAADTYTYNESTGLWENDYYTWNPDTHTTAPKSSQSYSYNPETNHWDTVDWRYNAATKTYEPNVVDTTAVPNYDPNPNTEPSNDQSPTLGNFNGFYNASISNAFRTLALSGNAALSGNTVAGSASTGSAYANATVINLLQSMGILGSGNVATFALDVPDHTGDILLSPDQLGRIAVAASGIAPPLTVNTQANGIITNDIAVQAASGNAAITENTSAGDASTGDAHAIANVVNAIGTSIGADNSFIGNLNIFGNLNGDILLPEGMLETLLASNAASSASAIPSNLDQAGLINAVNKLGIDNTIASDAKSGDATVSNNTVAGNATSGNALSNVTVLNLTGSDVIGADNLLVFVNVLGKWVGMIVNAPGATAASLGGGITKNTMSPAETTLNSDTTNTIANNLDVRAKSGDALLANNTQAGNATTGNATTSVNLANFINTKLSLSEWFGILFINVFGSWNGSFGVNTAAGTVTSTSPAGGNSNQPSTTSHTRVYAFAPTNPEKPDSTYQVVPTGQDQDERRSPDTSSLPTAVLASSTNPHNTITSGATPNSTQQGSFSILYPAIGILVAAVLLGVDRLYSARERHKA